MYIFTCEDSLNGILTGVYDAWCYKIAHRAALSEADIALTCRTLENLTLFSEYIKIMPSEEKAAKVRRTLVQKVGCDFFYTIAEAALAAQDAGKQRSVDKANAIYKTIVYALAVNPCDGSSYGRNVLHNLSNPYINRVFELSRAMHNEAHHLLGFLRFQELKNGVLLSVIHTKNDCLLFLAEHFTDRMPLENFIIYDEPRKMAAFHASGKDFMLAGVSEQNDAFLHHFSEKEKAFQELWKTFFESIAISARANPKLQAQNIPKRFWNDTVELSATYNSPVRS